MKGGSKKYINASIVGVAGGVAYVAATVIVAIVQVPVILFYLPKNIAGIWFLYVSFGAYIAFLDLGLSPTIGREISFALGGKYTGQILKYGKICQIISTAKQLFALLFIASLIICAVAGLFLISRLASEAIKEELLLSWLIFATGSSIILAGGAWNAALIGLGSTGLERMVRAVSLLLGTGIGLGLLGLGAGIIGLSVGWLMYATIGYLLMRYFSLKRLPSRNSLSPRFDIDLLKKITVPSLKWAAMGLGAILVLQTDNVVIAYVLGASQIPGYEAVAKIANTMLTLSMLLTLASSPYVSRYFAASELGLVHDVVLRSVRYGLSVMLFLVSYFVFFGEMVVDVWIGGDNFVGNPVLWVLLTMILLEAHHVTLAVATMATGKVVFAGVAIIAGIINIPLSILLASKFGLIGVAAGTLISQVITNTWYVPWLSLRLLKIGWRRYTLEALVPLLMLGCALFVGALVFRFAVDVQADIWFVILTFLGFFVFSLGVFYRVVMTDREKNYFVNFMKDLLR